MECRGCEEEMSVRSCDEAYLADRARASDQGHNGKAAIALHALMLLPGIHHLAHHLNTCTTCTMLGSLLFSTLSLFQFIFDEGICLCSANQHSPPPFLIEADHQSQRSLSHHFQHLLLIPLAALLLANGTDPCHHRRNVHYVGIAAVIQQSGTFLHSANWCLEAATCIQ